MSAENCVHCGKPVNAAEDHFSTREGGLVHAGCWQAYQRAAPSYTGYSTARMIIGLQKMIGWFGVVAGVGVTAFGFFGKAGWRPFLVGCVMALAGITAVAVAQWTSAMVDTADDVRRILNILQSRN
jgi:hypothetical protein